MVNDSHSPIPQAEENKNQYIACDVNRADRAILFQHITGQPVKQILHEVENNILHSFQILREDVRMAEDIYGPSVSHLQGKTVCHKVMCVGPIIVTNFPKGILYRYKNFTLCCDLVQINSIGFLNTISRHKLFSMGSMIKNRTLRMGLIRSINCTYTVVWRSPAYMLIVNLNHYGQIWLILASPSIACPRSNMSPILNDSMRPSRNVSDLDNRPCLSHGFQNK